MNQILKITVLILGSIILQTSLVSRIAIFGNKPDLPLVLTVSIALLKGSLYGESVGFAVGLLCDLSSGGPFLGIQSLSNAVIGYFIGLMRERFYSDNPITQSLSGFASTLADKLIALFSLFFLLSKSSFSHIHLHGILLTAIINSVFVIIVFRIVKKFLSINIK